MTSYKKVNLKQSFPDLENEINAFWEKNNIFEESIATRANAPEFNFYDGPPFATGTPHYGHILAGTIKDVIPRYKTMQGYKVERKFGWDCHGLPIENIVEKKLEISGKDAIEKKIGVHTFNETCRENVLTYVDEWKKTVKKMGRWVDMENDYKTMDTSFMESVWWVYKTIYDKGLIYEGYRVVPYCPRCSTPLSNFEVNQGYKDKQDKAVTVKFKVKTPPISPSIEGESEAKVEEGEKYILAWTTTPWTLPANLGLAVGENLVYAEILDHKTNETYILAEARLESYYKNEQDYTLVKTYPGSCLVGIEYEAIFEDFTVLKNQNNIPKGMAWGKNTYHVVLGHHVTTDSGTGIVHIAPAYGEDDFIIGKENDLGFFSHIDDLGATQHLLENNQTQVFEYNEMALKILKDEQKTVLINTIDHSYPHCWRCDSPLIYRAISAWYVAVEKIRDKMVANNEKIYWTPESIKHGRFGTWLAQARDWNISRNRYWGSAIPVWQNEDKTEELCIGSIKELYEYNKDFKQIEEKNGEYFYTKTGQKVDIHKHFVDEILLKNPKTGNTLKRIPEVLDCWFESGAMPYASKHYPFENKENFKFPADFIAEGLDQTRGWFYTLVILATALFDTPPFLNCIVNGTVLAEDGHKMSKSKKNYPDPNLIFDQYGADALRFYLMNSPVVEAQDFRFAQGGVEEVIKKVILPLWNTYSFFTTYANIDNFKPKQGSVYFARHGQSTSNIAGIMSGGNDNPKLTQKGEIQASTAGKKAKLANITFDVIISSPLDRAYKTAQSIAQEIGYTKEIIKMDGLVEQKYGEFEGKTLQNIADTFGISINNNKELRKIYKNSKEENYHQFDTRISETFQKICEEYPNKNILIVGHSGTIRPIARQFFNLDMDYAHLEMETANNSQLIKLPTVKLHNPLDTWIFSELNSLVKEVNNGFEKYKLNEATKPIVKFMDNLTNWYIRRSRKRFWKSENDQDKEEAYHTLFEVLVELTKIIAPVMPFISENIYKELTGKKSVHLDIFPETNPSFIFDSLNSNTQIVQDIITLGLAARANAKIRVRQPLAYIKIGVSLDNYYQEILKEELNVKEIRLFESHELPKKICKPNARLIGPKFGQDVKFIMNEAKAGNFEELANGNVKVGNFELHAGEFEIVFEKLENNSASVSKEILESGAGMVIALDTTLTLELKKEGDARDIVRQIQEARKEAGYNVEDRIEIALKGENIEDVLVSFGSYIETETLSAINNLVMSNADFIKQADIEDGKIEIFLKK